MAKKTKVALLFGGRSAEHEVSLISAAFIYNNLDKSKFETVSIYINKEGQWRSTDSPLLSQAELEKGPFFSFLPWSKEGLPCSLKADLYFPVLHGPHGEDGTIQGLFEMADVPYVGAAVLASALGMDKAVAKTLFQAQGLPVVKHMIFLENDWEKGRKSILETIAAEFKLPFFIKPVDLGSSIGITKVKEPRKTASALECAFRYGRKILVEEGIQGRELECSVLGNDEPRASLPGEIFASREFYDYKDKYINGQTSFGIPAEIPSSLVKEIQRISIEAFKAIGCQGMARVDFFLQEKTGKIFLNEINTIPGFTEISMYPKLWEVSGLAYPQLLEELMHLGFERHRKKKRSTEGFIP